MEKIFNNQAELAKRLDSKTGRFAIEMPDFYKDEKGNYIVKDESIVINSLEGFNDYIAKHQEIVEFLGDNYPKLVSTIYKNTLTSLADPLNKTAFSRVLTGFPVKNAVIYQTAHAADSLSVFKGFIKTYNAKNIGFEGEEYPLPKVKRTAKQFMRQFQNSNVGYFVPEIDKNGLVVHATNSKDDFKVKFVAVPDVDVTFFQLFDYFTAPFGDKLGDAGIHFPTIKGLCANAYAEIGSEEMAKKVQNLVNYLISVYPISFVNIKPDKVKVEPFSESDQEFEFEPITKPGVEFDPITKPRSGAEVEEFEVVFTTQFTQEPTSMIKDIKGNFKYHSSIQKLSFTEEMKKVEREA